jgi:HK97 family phage major capsid protein
MKVLSEGIDTAGGFYVPPEFRTELVKKMATMTSVRPNAQVFTVGSDLVHFPKVTYTSDDLYTSGVRFAWTAEAPAANIAESTNPIAGRVTIPVHTATAAIYVTRALMEDAQFDILGYISSLLSESFSLGLEDAYTNGDAIGKPQGFTQHPNATVLNSAGGMMVLSGTAGQVAWGISATPAGATTGVTGAEAALPPQYESSAKWYANKKTYAALRNLTDAQTRPLWYSGDSFPSVNNGFNPTLLGYPVVKNQFMPDIAAANEPLALGDMKGYYIVDRVGLSVEVYREIAALRDMVVIYARQRTGGQLVHDWRMKLMKSNNA